MILGEKVRLRPIEQDDLPRFVEWFGDPDVRRHLGIYLPFSKAQEERWFEDLQDRLERQETVALAIETAEGIHIGSISLDDIDWRNRNAELGIAIGDKAHWDQGYGADAIRTLLGLAFDEMNLHRVFLRVHEANARGIRCYEKVGFQQEGILRENVFMEGGYSDTYLMSILKVEFQANE